MSLERKETGHEDLGDLVNELTDAQRREILEKRLHAAAFAEIVSVLMRSPTHKDMPLKHLETLVVPPFLARQFSIARAKVKDGPFPLFPVGVALWASVSDEIDKRLSNVNEGSLDLKPDEWKSGENVWLIELAARQEVGVKILEDLKKGAFRGKKFKMRLIDANGTKKVETVMGIVS